MKKEFKLGGSSTHSIDVSGKFALELLIEPEKRKKFRLTNLLSEVPVGVKNPQRKYFKDVNGQDIMSYYISKIKTTFDPDESIIDQENLIVLLDHSDVRIEGMTSEEHQFLVNKKQKRSNPRFLLYSLDKRKNEELSKEKKLVKAQALIFDSKYTSAQLCYLCAAFGIPYRIEESFEGARRDALEDKLSKFVKISEANSDKLINMIEDLKSAEDSFYIDQMLRLGYLVEESGFYKLSNDPKPLAIDRKTLMNYFDNNIENYNFLKAEVKERMKEEYEANK